MSANAIEISLQGKEVITDAESYPQKHHDHGLVQVNYYKRKFRRELRRKLKRCLREGIANESWQRLLG